MKDLLMLLLTVGFFALCVAYVWWCDRIIGPDPADLTEELTEEHVDEPAVAHRPSEVVG